MVRSMWQFPTKSYGFQENKRGCLRCRGWDSCEGNHLKDAFPSLKTCPPSPLGPTWEEFDMIRERDGSSSSSMFLGFYSNSLDGLENHHFLKFSGLSMCSLHFRFRGRFSATFDDQKRHPQVFRAFPLPRHDQALGKSCFYPTLPTVKSRD